MKQSTKLLSLVLALIMAFSCMTVIGNASLVQSEVIYDSIDDAALTPEQVADLALDLVDNDLLAGIDTIDLSILGEIRLNSVDHIFEDLVSLVNSYGGLLSLLGNVGDLKFDALKNSSNSEKAWQRYNGDLVVVGQLLEFIGNSTNAGVLSRAAYGLSGGDGISLGLIASFLDLGEIGDMLNDIPGMLVGLVYDMLVFGSYGYDKDLDDIKASGKTLANTYPEVSTLDGIVNNALLNLLINPQDYEWIDNDGDGEKETKSWNMDEVISPSLKAWVDANGRNSAINYISPLNKSLFEIIDILAQFAIDDLGIPALNNNLKKGLMEAVGVEFYEAASVPSEVMTVFNNTSAYVTYIGYDCMAKANNGEWYYTTLKTVTMTDDNGNALLDDEGNEKTEKVRKYYKANTATVNEFYSLINWDWKFVNSSTAPDTSKGEIQLLYSNIVKDYDEDGTASIVEGLNDLVKLVYDAALADNVKADYKAFVQKYIDSSNTTGYVGGSNDNFMKNVDGIAKYILANYGELVFGSSSAYAHLDPAKIGPMDTIELVAMIGPDFFADVMPQLIIPKNADGTYAFHEGEQIYEFGALIIREFVSDITPNVDYDAYIFEDGVGSENGRQFKASNTKDQWFNLILNMGLDIAYTYLYNISNFGDMVTFNSTGTAFASNANFRYAIKGLANATYLPDLPDMDPYSSTRWQNMLDEAILWAARYVGSVEGTSVIKGLDVTSISKVSGPLNKLSYILNSLLPLGFVNGFSSETYDFDVQLFLYDGLKAFIEDFDLSRILGLLGRNTKSDYNFLGDTNLVNGVLQLVNSILSLVFRTNILQGVSATGTAQSLDAVVSKASLQTTIKTLLMALNNNKKDLLYNALPVVGKLISGWGTEQEFNTPDIGLGESITLNGSGATNEAVTVTVRNASEGVWRHYKNANGSEGTDKQYVIVPKSVSATTVDTNNNAKGYVTVGGLTTTEIPYGGTGSFTYSVSGVPATGALTRIDYSYQIKGEDGNYIAGGKTFTARKYVWLNYADTDEGSSVGNTSESYNTFIYTPQYVGLSNPKSAIQNMDVGGLERLKSGGQDDQAQWITPSNAGRKQDGISIGTVGFDGTIVQDDIKWKVGMWSTPPYQDKTNPLTGSNYAVGDRKPSMAFAKAEYPAVKFSLFTNQQITLLDKDGGNARTTNVTDAGFDDAAWKAANKTSGSRTSWTMYLGIKKTEYSTATYSIIWYDDIYRSELRDLVGDELGAVRLADVYNTTGTSYANDVLVSENVPDDASTPDEDEFELRATNSTATATVNGKEVTAIDNATAWARYQKALVMGARAAYQNWRDDANTLYNFREIYEELRVATNDVEYLRKNAEEIAQVPGADDIDGAIDSLKSTLDALEADTTDRKNYTDYQMYRLNRYNEARDDAWYYINLKNDASNATVDEIDENFPYTWINEDDLRDLVEGDEKETLITALLEAPSAEEKAEKTQWLKNKKNEYGRVNYLDVVMATNMLTLTEDRLLYRAFTDNGETEEVTTTYLDGELDSIDNMFDLDNDASEYTETSWNRFMDAYDNAVAVYDDPTQKTVFEAKYNLMVARNRLVKVGEEADYSELDALIAQAEQALANTSLYDNTNKELGQVLAELGYDAFTNADGNSIQLFPGSALLVKAEGYHEDDQDKVDRAARELKEALARLKFKGLTITGNNAVVEKEVTIVAANEAEGIKEVKATIATIAAGMNSDAVKGLFTVNATNANVGVDNITVSKDLHYTVDTELDGFAGTNSVVTFYTINGGVKIPVATIKLVVKGDLNGDGAVDVLDGAYAQLVSTDKGELEGCYFIAANLKGDATVDKGEIDAEDYGAVVNLIVA